MTDINDPTTHEPIPAAAVDLMAALKASLERAKKNREELCSRFETLDSDATAQPF